MPPSFTRARLTLYSRTLGRTTHSYDEDYSGELENWIEREISSIDLGDAWDSKWSHSHTESRSWTTDLCLPVTLSGGDSLVIVPSFESCLMSRQYELKIAFSLSSAASTLLGLASIEYRFPINIVARSPNIRGDVMQALEVSKDFDDERPSYWDVHASPADVAPMENAPLYTDAISELELDRRPSWQEKDSLRP